MDMGESSWMKRTNSFSNYRIISQNKNMKKRIVYFVAFLITCLVVSCSEHTNDDKYQSRVPRFSKIVAQESEIKVGETIVFTAVQREAGHLLDRTTYTWTITPQNVSKSKASVPINGVYDGVNPTDTVVFITVCETLPTLKIRKPSRAVEKPSIVPTLIRELLSVATICTPHLPKLLMLNRIYEKDYFIFAFVCMFCCLVHRPTGGRQDLSHRLLQV